MAPADPPDPDAANDNGDANGPAPEALRKVDDVVFQIARIIGRRMAREDFEALQAANDNAQKQTDK
jgi:hypothetical protein